MKGIILSAILLCSCFILYSAEIAADTTFSITGKVTFKKDITVTVTCLTEQEFEEELPAKYFYVQELSAADLEKGYIEYKIDNIPEGDYLVFAFQDKNENDKLDRILIAPREPWDIYGLARPAKGKPNFKKLHIHIDYNLSTLNMKLKKGF